MTTPAPCAGASARGACPRLLGTTGETSREGINLVRASAVLHDEIVCNVLAQQTPQEIKLAHQYADMILRVMHEHHLSTGMALVSLDLARYVVARDIVRQSSN